MAIAKNFDAPSVEQEIKTPFWESKCVAFPKRVFLSFRTYAVGRFLGALCAPKNRPNTGFFVVSA